MWAPPAPAIAVPPATTVARTPVSSRKPVVPLIAVAALVAAGVGVVLTQRDDDPAPGSDTTVQLDTTQPDATGNPDAGSGRVLSTLSGHTAAVDSVAFSPDGTTIVTASYRDGTAVIWDATTGDQLATLDGPADEVDPVALGLAHHHHRHPARLRLDQKRLQ